MNIRILSVLGVMALMVATWFFYKEDVEVKPALPAAPAATYEVTEIKAVQTNPETGETEYTVTAESLVQNAGGNDEMKNATVRWQPPNSDSFVVTAQRAILNQETGDLHLSHGFRLEREATKDQPAMVITGDKLVANTKTRVVSSSEPLTVNKGNDSFKAASFTANIQTGEYAFDRIEVLFTPPKRDDKPLF